MDNPPQNPITRFCPEDRKRLEENTDKMPLVHVGLACMTMMIISTTTFLMCDRPTWLICSITWMPVLRTISARFVPLLEICIFALAVRVVSTCPVCDWLIRRTWDWRSRVTRSLYVLFAWWRQSHCPQLTLIVLLRSIEVWIKKTWKKVVIV